MSIDTPQPRHDPDRLDNAQRNVISNNRVTFWREIPSPTEWWVNSLPGEIQPDDVGIVVADGINPAQLNQLREQNLVQIEDGFKPGPGYKTRKMYRLRHPAWDHLQELRESEDGLPCCGSKGFHNVDGGGFECKKCGATHDRKTVEEVEF